MAEKNSKQKKINALRLPRVLNSLQKKMTAFTAANPNGSPAKTVSQDEIRQGKIDSYEEAFKLAVAGNYRKYRFPYKTLGANSSAADALTCDEERLFAAYNLFKAVQDANREFGKYETKITGDIITTPLTLMEQYTTGDEFVYLQAWLYFEKKARDFIPYMFLQPDGTTYVLRFYSAAEFHWNYKAKEVMSVIRACFYPTETL